MIETDIAIIGAGPAGMMAAISAAERSKKIALFEANTTAGRKLLITGRGRCNLTHVGKPDEIIKAFAPFDRFVRHCMYEFPPKKVMDFFKERGLDSAPEEDGCVFPVTNSAADVKQILEDELKKKDVKIYYGRKIQAITKENDLFIIPSEKFTLSAKALIIATGGVSWPQTGSTGDGYKFASAFGHKIIEPIAALVPLIANERFCGSLAGLGIQKVSISCKIAGKKISSSGAMIFTHQGIGGPAVFDLSRNVAGIVENNYKISIDFLPDINAEQLEKQLTQTFAENPKKHIELLVSQFFPKALATIICEQAEAAKMEAGQINKKLRKKLVENLKAFVLTIVSAQEIERATVTRGGVDIAEIDNKTMQSKIVKELFFAGEVMNVDGPCGGYNLQFAFSSGFIAGKNAYKSLE
jgi:predicted Rossmann fold flavoprotein